MWPKKQTEETKQKLREAKMGDKNPAKRPEVRKKIGLANSIALKGNKNAKGNKGKPKSEEHKRKIGEANRGKHKRSGKNNYNWKGGITPQNAKIRNTIQFRLWREAVFARDNWTCQKYGIKGGKLHSHHIKNFAEYSELRFAIDNGITFSEKAHKEFHKKYGIKNNTREQLKEFLS